MTTMTIMITMELNRKHTESQTDTYVDTSGMSAPAGNHAAAWAVYEG